MTKDYDAWEEGYKNILRSSAYRFNENNSVKKKIVGNWIVSAKIIGGCQGIICIYNKNTLMEHYSIKTIGLSCCDDAPEEIKAFYRRAFKRDFAKVVELAETWD